MADNYTFKDAGGNTVTHASEEISSGVHASEHVPVDAAGVEIFYKGTTVLATAVSVATTATALPASALAARRVLWVYNNGAATIFLGPAGVTTSNGFPLLPGQSVSLEVGPLVIYGIVATGTVNARIMEVA
jgi:hypothetical protein